MKEEDLSALSKSLSEQLSQIPIEYQLLVRRLLKAERALLSAMVSVEHAVDYLSAVRMSITELVDKSLRDKKPKKP